MAIEPQDRTKLVELARSAVAAEVSGKPLPKVDAPKGIMAETRGCFVTLKNADRLRGCIGTFQPSLCLAETIVEMGQAAARDPRFVCNPITPSELSKLTVEVSVLSPLQPTNNPEKLEIGKHGIYIISGQHHGCFLPEVATEMGWNVEQFLSECCSHKAGMRSDAWKDPQTKVFLFTSEKFDR